MANKLVENFDIFPKFRIFKKALRFRQDSNLKNKLFL